MTEIPTGRSPIPPGEPRLILPFLAGFYDKVRGLSYLLIRVAVGGLLIFHAYISGKLTGDTTIATFTASLAKRGLEPSEPLAYVVFFNETIGAVMLIVGLLTRVVAASIAIELKLVPAGKSSTALRVVAPLLVTVVAPRTEKFHPLPRNGVAEALNANAERINKPKPNLLILSP